jgi:hypothetical protein
MILPNDIVMDAEGNRFSCIQWNNQIDGISVMKGGKWVSMFTKDLVRVSESSAAHKMHNSPETLNQLVFPFMYKRR